MQIKEKKIQNLFVGIGLQKVDNLTNSSVFNEQLSRYVNGDIDLNSFEDAVKNNQAESRVFEADLVAIRIAKLLDETTFEFSLSFFKNIHAFLFKDIYQSGGKFRTFNISKKESILNGASVSYCDFRELEETIHYDLKKEKSFTYKGKTFDKKIEHIANFVTDLWQIHPFEEGNTRTTAIFLIKYLESLGFNLDTSVFIEGSEHFRNCLVKANYSDIKKEISTDNSDLLIFLNKLIKN
ncbi:MAG: Fic family protein [Bacilli bacterium]|nr:Fic family protein [Bacilli bacterium]